MCGIAGVFHFNRDAAVEGETLRAMSAAIPHRGPDDEQFFRDPSGRLGFAFRRLSIIDLAHGAQPMSTNDERFWVVFNGEIYNHLEVRKELEAKGRRFRTHCDTEVILYAFAEYGPRCLERFQGMFAFAVWDSLNRTLFLARDRVGIKPLYYATVGGTFLFASEIKALFQHPDLSPRLNRDELARYFTFLCVPPPATMFEGVSKLRAAHSMTVEEGTNPGLPRRYWTPLPTAPSRASEEELARELRDTLIDSVRARLMSDVPFGVFLSGGIDSSTVVSIMARNLDRPVETFSVGYKDDPGFNEFVHARRTAELFETNHHEVLIDHEDFRRFLPRLVHHQDEPIADPVCVPLYFVAELARQNGVIVTQVGEGSDELFFGYAFFDRVRRMVERLWVPLAAAPGMVRAVATRMAEPFVDLQRRDFLRRLREGGEPFWGGAVTFYPEELKRLAPGLAADTRRGEIVGAIYDEIDSALPEADFPTRIGYLELMFRLPELLLMRVDKMTMATSVEGRVPFLDHRVVELAFRIPGELKIKNGVTKSILKCAVSDLIPEEIIHRPKVGFHVPVTRWFEQVLSPLADQALLESSMRNLGIWEEREVRRLLSLQREGKGNYGMRIWSLVNFALWYRHWIEGEDF